jgi:hypothetical protein
VQQTLGVDLNFLRQSRKSSRIEGKRKKKGYSCHTDNNYATRASYMCRGRRYTLVAIQEVRFWPSDNVACTF